MYCSPDSIIILSTSCPCARGGKNPAHSHDGRCVCCLLHGYHRTAGILLHEIIEAAIETLNVAPPQVCIEAKFAEITQEDSRAMQLVIWIVTFIAMLALTLFIRYSRMANRRI